MSLDAPAPELVALLQARASFVLAVHKGPDGDATGSGLALYHALTDAGKQAQIVAPTAVPRHYLWMPGAEHFGQQVTGEPQVAIMLDCDGLERVGQLRQDLQKTSVLINIDHHTNEAPFGDLVYVDRRAASTAQLVYRLLQALQWPVTPPIATCLYTGIATDTGFFRFENTDETALRDVAELVAAGAAPAAIAEAVSEAQPLYRLRLRGRALRAMQLDPSERIAWSVLMPEDFREAGAGAGDTEGIVDALKQVERQQAAVLFKAPERESEWQISLRSWLIDVAEVARQFGGGGHARAAGCDVKGPLNEVKERVLGAVTAALDEVKGA